MRVIPTRIHGMADYGMAILLIVSPYLFGFATGGAKQWLPMVAGVALLISSLMTRYELGVYGAIPMPVHLGLDVAMGLLLAASPWLFGFSSQVFWPHLIFGLIEVGTAAMTDPKPRGGPAFA